MKALKSTSIEELELGVGLSSSQAKSVNTAAKNSDDIFGVVSKAKINLDRLESLRDHKYTVQLSGDEKTTVLGVEFNKSEIDNVLKRVKQANTKQLQLQGMAYNPAKRLMRSRNKQKGRDFQDIHKMAGHISGNHPHALSKQDLTRLRDTFGRNNVTSESTDKNGQKVNTTGNRILVRWQGGKNKAEIMGTRARTLKTVRKKIKSTDKQQSLNVKSETDAAKSTKKLRSQLRNLSVHQREYSKAHSALQDSMNAAMTERTNL
jgi:hypothetical protein